MIMVSVMVVSLLTSSTWMSMALRSSRALTSALLIRFCFLFMGSFVNLLLRYVLNDCIRDQIAYVSARGEKFADAGGRDVQQWACGAGDPAGGRLMQRGRVFRVSRRIESGKIRVIDRCGGAGTIDDNDMHEADQIPPAPPGVQGEEGVSPDQQT